MANKSRPASETSENQSSTKKRRVTKQAINTETAAVTNAGDTDLYAEVVGYEEKEAKERSSVEDAELYYSTCSEIRKLLTEICELKCEGPDRAQHMKEKQIQASLKILTLKKLNRLEKVRTKESRLALQKAREQVDSDHLQLQNMLYEVVHLTKEVKKCLEFKSKDEEMDLVPIDEFYAKAPDNVSKSAVTKKDEHQLRLARLQWELLQRKELSVQCRKLEANKEAVGKEIESKKEQLNNLGPNLKTILDATKPLQDTLGILIDKTKKLHAKARLLPKPLYVLFVQADAFSHGLKWVTANIIGECDKAVPEELHLDDISSDDSDSDNDGDQPHRRKITFQDRRKSSNSNPSDRVEQKKKECLKKHPLSVVIEITTKTGEVLSVEMQWLVFLEVVCVVPTVKANVAGSIAAEDVLSMQNILASMFPGDTGEELPNANSFYQLRRAGLESFPLSAMGMPYKWAQEMCGIDTMAAAAEARVPLCQANLEKVLRALRARLGARLALARELQLLEKGFTVPLKKMTTLLTSFAPSTLPDFERLASAQPLLTDELIDGTFLFYKAVVQCGTVRVNALVAVSPNYPQLAPVVLLELSHKGTFTALNCVGLRDIEREVNVFLDGEEDAEKPKQCGLLSRQVQKLLFCIEIFIHTEYGTDTAASRSMYFRKCQGRDRSHPYRFINSAGGIFTHR